MKTVTLEVRAPEEGMDEFAQDWRSGKAQRAARIGFATPELLWKVLSAKRWELLKALCGAGPVSIREAARRVQRDVKAVHGDITALLAAGLLNRTETGNVEFPYEAVSCPVLPRTPFSAAALEAELERETRAFFARPENFRIDAATRSVWLSELLDCTS